MIFLTSPVSAGGWGCCKAKSPLASPRMTQPSKAGVSAGSRREDETDWKKEGLSDGFKFIGSATEMRRVLLWGGLLYGKQTHPCCGECLYPAVCFHPSHTPVRLFSVTPPTPQPIDDVDIYFETPADDKEHSRFQRAKEQLEIRHRSRMERVRGSLFFFYENERRHRPAICHPFRI